MNCRNKFQSSNEHGIYQLSLTHHSESMSATMMISLAGMSERFVGFGDTVAFTHTVKDDSGKGREGPHLHDVCISF